MINKYEAEVAIRDLADRLPEECESMIATMVDCNAFALEASIERHREWREAKGIPHFRATLRFDNEMRLPLIGGDYIQVEIRGTFNQSKKGLTVSSYVVEECRVIDSCEPHARSF